jgi:hypothetical protein
MPEPAQINRSLSTVRTELEFLRDSGVLLPQQLESIMAQLPQNGQASVSLNDTLDLPDLSLVFQQYVDPRYGGQQWGPSPPQFTQITQAAQDPQSPAHPQNKHVGALKIFP